MPLRPGPPLGCLLDTTFLSLLLWQLSLPRSSRRFTEEDLGFVLKYLSSCHSSTGFSCGRGRRGRQECDRVLRGKTVRREILLTSGRIWQQLRVNLKTGSFVGFLEWSVLLPVQSPSWGLGGKSLMGDMNSIVKCLWSLGVGCESSQYLERSVIPGPPNIAKVCWPWPKGAPTGRGLE